MVNPSRIRHLISSIEINEDESVGTKIYVDFMDHKGRARWYLLFAVRFRTFKAVRIGRGGGGTADLPNNLRRYLISILPPHIIAHCIAASLGVSTNLPRNHAKEETMDTRFNKTTAYSYAQVEGALCAWEWILENKDHPVLDVLQNDLGSPGLRMMSIQAGDICDRVYKHMEGHGYEFQAPYDFEFVPSVCAKIDWAELANDNQYGGAPYVPDIHGFFCAMVAEDRSRNSDPLRRDFHRASLDTWLERCTEQAEKQWGYAGLIDDHEDKTSDAYNAGQSPFDFVKWLGEKYDLTPASEMRIAS